MTTRKSEIKKKSVLIAGAGPAGASLAARLARGGHEVTLVEKETFPRHKLCGEFISPECIKHFRDLGVGDEMLSSGGDRILRTIFYSEKGHRADVPSELFAAGSRGALGLSRARMDQLLLEKAAEYGVEVRQGTSVKELNLQNGSVRQVAVRDKAGKISNLSADIFIDATGRARVLSKIAEKKAGINRKQKAGKWVAFKAHFNNVHMESGRCEIYFFRGGYGGLNYVEHGLANHCFLVRSDVVKQFKGDAEAVFGEVVMRNQRVRETMRNAERTGKWIAVSVVRFGSVELTAAPNLFSVGDSAAFIDPFTGSGMLMALQSSETFAQCVNRSNNNYDSIRKHYSLLHRRRFSKRLRLCAVMRYLSSSSLIASVAIQGLSKSRPVTQLIAKATRFDPSREPLS